MPVWISGALVAVFTVVTRRTRFGRYLYAVGGNERAAQLTGLNLRRIRVWVYTLGGGLAGIAGLILTARLDSATPSAGFGYELDSIAAVVIGGTSLNGGRGSVPGTVLGCLIIGILNNGLVLLEVSPFYPLALATDRREDTQRIGVTCVMWTDVGRFCCRNEAKSGTFGQDPDSPASVGSGALPSVRRFRRGQRNQRRPVSRQVGAGGVFKGGTAMSASRKEVR